MCSGSNTLALRCPLVPLKSNMSLSDLLLLFLLWLIFSILNHLLQLFATIFFVPCFPQALQIVWWILFGYVVRWIWRETVVQLFSKHFITTSKFCSFPDCKSLQPVDKCSVELKETAVQAKGHLHKIYICNILRRLTSNSFFFCVFFLHLFALTVFYFTLILGKSWIVCRGIGTKMQRGKLGFGCINGLNSFQWA